MWINDWKRKAVSGSDGEEEGGSVVCAGDLVEGEQGERVRWRLQVVLQWADERGRNGVGIILAK